MADQDQQDLEERGASKDHLEKLAVLALVEKEDHLVRQDLQEKEVNLEHRVPLDHKVQLDL